MRKRFFRRLMITTLALSLLIAPIASASKVYAVDAGYNTDGSNGGSNTVSGTGSGGVSVNKTGVIFYCVDSENGSIINRVNSDSDQAVILSYSRIDNKPDEIQCKGAEPNLVENMYFGNGYFGDELGDYKYDMPKLFTWNDSSQKFESHYTEWNNWFENTAVTDPLDGMTLPMSAYIVKHFFPKAWNMVAEAHSNGTESRVSLIVEPIAWHSLFSNGSGDSAITGTRVLTPSGWAGTKQDNNLDNVRTFTCSFDRGIFAWTMRLERVQFGWWTFGPAMQKDGMVSNEDIRTDGYGVNIYNLGDQSTLHTTVTPQPAPADVESPTPTNLSVVKVYESVNAETQEITTEGVYITNDAYPQLSVDTEEQWDIISAETVSPLITSIDANDTYETITSGTTTKQEFSINSLPLTVTLSQQEPTLILRYRFNELTPIPVRLTGTHTVPEQRITQSFRDTVTPSMAFTQNKIPCSDVKNIEILCKQWENKEA